MVRQRTANPRLPRFKSGWRLQKESIRKDALFLEARLRRAMLRCAQFVVASFVSLAMTFLCCASKSHLALTPLLLLSKTKPHGRFMPRRQLRHYAVLGFVFGQLLTWICEAKKHASACFFALEARLRRRDPLRSNGRRKLRIACGVFSFLPQRSQLVRREGIHLVAELAADGHVLSLGDDALQLLGPDAADRLLHALA